MDNIPKPIKDLANKTLTKVADKFVDFVIVKYTGKSIKVFEAEGNIEADKVKTKWELLEKPFWLQAEAEKMDRQYSNLGNALIKSTPLIESDKKPTGDNDVFWGLLEHSKEISNEEMQDLIAKIIAGEYNKPGAYSMNTLQRLKSLGEKELRLFEQVCGLLLNGGQLPKKLFTGDDNVKELMKELGLDFGNLQTLQSLGLFLPNDMTNNIPNPDRQKYSVNYFDETILFEPENPQNQQTDTSIRVPGYYGLSDAGEQILTLLSPKKSDVYFQWLKKNYSIRNYKITT